MKNYIFECYDRSGQLVVSWTEPCFSDDDAQTVADRARSKYYARVTVRPEGSPAPTPPSLLTPTDHPYYMSGETERYESWADYLADWGNADPDLNLMVRFDVERDDEGLCLNIYRITPRKGYTTHCAVYGLTAEDEPAVRAHLQAGLNYLMKLWAPLMPTETP